MIKEAHRKKLIAILDHSPELKEILMSRDDVGKKRKRIRKYLAVLLNATFDDQPTIPPLEWVLARDAIRVFRNILSKRSERLSGYSMLRYIHDLLHNPEKKSLPDPSHGFVAELEHLIKGIMGKSDVYSEKPPAFIKYHGGKAARLRSADLSKMARNAGRYLNRYPSGLDNDVLRRRYKNKARILKYFGATELEWGKWKWHTRHIIRDADTLGKLIQLSDDEYEAVSLVRQHKIPFGVTPYYLSLMDYRRQPGEEPRQDAAIRAQVIPGIKAVRTLIEQKRCNEASLDFMLERDTSPIEGITRRYPMIVIIKPIMTCPQICSYCQRNWEIEDVYSRQAVLSKEKTDRAVEWIKNTPEITEVLITGGDPLLLSDSRLEELLSRLSGIQHVERIRIGTRMIVTLPQRVTDTLVKTVNRFHIPGRREIVIVTHFEHPYEITPQSMEAVQKFRRYGIDVYNQLVFTFFNSRKFEAAALRKNLRLIGVTPYYTFNTKGKEETDDFRVPIPRLMQEQKEEARLFPGTLRTDEIVFNVPGLGKNYLRATQHHDIITILPEGLRVYEFHPWEKKLSLVDTYIYTDVSIYNYLNKLKGVGEDVSDYKTIWYYY